MNNWKLTHVILWLRHRIDLYNSQMNVPLANRRFKRILISFNQLPDLGNFVIIRCPCCNPCLIVEDKMVGLFKYNVTWSCLSVIRNFKFEFDRFIYMCIDCGVSRYLRWFIFCKSICEYISKIGTNYFNDQKKWFSKFGLAYFFRRKLFWGTDWCKITLLPSRTKNFSVLYIPWKGILLRKKQRFVLILFITNF